MEPFNYIKKIVLLKACTMEMNTLQIQKRWPKK